MELCILFDEIWLVKEGVGLYHHCTTEKELPINIQLFSGFLGALVTFSEQIAEQAIRNIDFMDSRFSFISNPDYMIIVRTSIERPLERTLQQLSALDQELKQESDIIELLKKTSNFRNLPLQIYSEYISPIFNRVMEQGLEADKQLRQIDLITIIQIGRGIYQLIQSMASKEFYEFINSSSTNEDNIMKYFSSTESIDPMQLPDLSYSDFTANIRRFLSLIAEYLEKERLNPNNIKMSELRIQIIDFISQNYRLLKYFNLDETITTKILPLFR